MNRKTHRVHHYTMICFLVLLTSMWTHEAAAQDIVETDPNMVVGSGALSADVILIPQGDEALGVELFPLLVRCSSRTPCAGKLVCSSDGICMPQSALNGNAKGGERCYATDHCLSKLCVCGRGTDRNTYAHSNPGGKCLPARDNQFCEPEQLNGQGCWRNENCQSNYCTPEKICAPMDGTGNSQSAGGNYCHHAEHCESKLCMCISGTKPISSGFCGTGGFLEGGRCLAKQKFGANCARGENCPPGGQCVENRCAQQDGTTLAGGYCHHNNHCASGLCECPGGTRDGFCGSPSNPDSGTCMAPGARRTLGMQCSNDSQCSSGLCADGQRCATRGTGVRGGYCHHDNHCSSGLQCSCPLGKSWGFCSNYEDGNNQGTCQP